MVTETGESRAEARRTGGKMKRFYDLMDKDAKGTLTNEERSEFTTIQNDAKVKRGIEVQKEIQGLRSERGLVKRDASGDVADGTREQRIDARAD